MHRTIFALMATFSLSSTLNSAPAHGNPIAAGWEVATGGNTAGSFGNTTPGRAQSFTVECGGRLESVSLRIARFEEYNDGKLRVAITRVDAEDRPTGDPLAVTEVPYEHLGEVSNLAGLVSFDLSASDLILEQGERYAFTVEPTELRDAGNFLYLNGDSGDAAGYDGGLAVRLGGNGQWFPSTTTDWRFEVRVAAEGSTTPVRATGWGAIKAESR